MAFDLVQGCVIVSTLSGKQHTWKRVDGEGGRYALEVYETVRTAPRFYAGCAGEAE